MPYRRLFEPLTIKKGFTVKNRIFMSAIHHLYTPGGGATDRFKQYYWTRAEGGAGLVVVGGARIDDRGASLAMMSLQEDALIPGWREFTRGMHERDCKVGVQLYHAGRYARSANLPEGEAQMAPSAVYSAYSKATPRAMTREEIAQTVQNFAAAARRAREAGFDAVELIGSAGYLISQFLSPLTNQREDEYGGELQNRLRFPLEVIAACRGAVGEDFPLTIRIAGNDFVEGGNTGAQAVEIARAYAGAGVDMINVTGGWHESRVPQITAEVPRGGYSYLAADIKKAVPIPVAVSNRINDPGVAEELLALGRADAVSLGRTLIADPDWPRKAQAGRVGEIRRCVACNQGCLAKTFFSEPIECLVNARAGLEYRGGDRPAAAPKRILVVGAGPAGAEFSVRAAQRGHRVTLWDRGSAVGGGLHLCAAPPDKGEFLSLASYFEHALEAAGVEVVLNREAHPEDVAGRPYDAVVIATGAEEKQLAIPREDDTVPVYTAAQILRGEAVAGKHVVVVGGSSVGLETAQYLARSASLSPELLFFLMARRAEPLPRIEAMLNHSDRVVTVVEMTDKLGAGFDPGTAWPVTTDLKRLGVFTHKRAQVSRLADNRAVLVRETDEGETYMELPCDTVVTAVGYRPDDRLYRQLSGKVPSLYRIGDCGGVGKVADAIRAGADLAAQI